jgi:hypothetical protein
MMAEMCEVICLMALPVAKILSVVDEWIMYIDYWWNGTYPDKTEVKVKVKFSRYRPK